MAKTDWTNLAARPAGPIADTLLANDVADYIRFRAVCSAWRACANDPRVESVFDRRYHPRRWIMLRHAGSIRGRTCFLNVFTAEFVHVRLPDPRRHYILGPTAEGLVLLCRKGTLVVQLLNPLTGQLTDFPRANTLLSSDTSYYQIMDNELKNFQLLNAGLAENSMVALHYEFNRLAVAKPGDKNWIRLDTSCGIISALPFEGRFYCATDKDIVVLQAMEGQQPELVMAASYELERDGQLFVYLAENHGKLILTRWFPPNHSRGQRHGTCMVYQVDLDAGKTVFMPPVDEHAVFISFYGGRALIVPIGLSPSIIADTVYLCKRKTTRDADPVNFIVYSLVDGNVVQDCRAKCPCSIVDHLSCYVRGELFRCIN
ncbi:hypothetical protein PR202_gb21340 [Eleusine coracana subsp. coracana]|uniref:KIB1-4 beta-propeller domain-containing protein n=1 Tax=Eleusine coracana subsp. coracana TaxID=191504 RepID=A0AAV5FDE1_ELECO|nr:hypothetical protein QOZ80_7BG0604940 [Eleusine coracana subsp. coracana]GJN32809.1 hypothetical protein PR202_gb21340 [Eleusine coracana subsp. coracana]